MLLRTICKSMTVLLHRRAVESGEWRRHVQQLSRPLGSNMNMNVKLEDIDDG